MEVLRTSIEKGKHMKVRVLLLGLAMMVINCKGVQPEDAPLQITYITSKCMLDPSIIGNLLHPRTWREFAYYFITGTRYLDTETIPKGLETVGELNKYLRNKYGYSPSVVMNYCPGYNAYPLGEHVLLTDYRLKDKWNLILRADEWSRNEVRVFWATWITIFALAVYYKKYGFRLPFSSSDTDVAKENKKGSKAESLKQ